MDTSYPEDVEVFLIKLNAITKKIMPAIDSILSIFKILTLCDTLSIYFNLLIRGGAILITEEG